jgi:hypothetical protein
MIFVVFSFVGNALNILCTCVCLCWSVTIYLLHFISFGILLVLFLSTFLLASSSGNFLSSLMRLAYLVAKKGEKNIYLHSYVFLYVCSFAYIYMPVCVCPNDYDCYFMLLHLFCDYVRFYVDVDTHVATS